MFPTITASSNHYQLPIIPISLDNATHQHVTIYGVGFTNQSVEPRNIWLNPPLPLVFRISGKTVLYHVCLYRHLAGGRVYQYNSPTIKDFW